ncbi:MAG: hypothetical protein Q8K89_13835 [Actinomycetota bacterium]|nr:hypothetical protein [Actinomycetota bacterium]
MKKGRFGVSLVIGLVVLAGVGASLTGCSKSPAAAESSDASANSNVDSPPTLEVVEPSADAVVSAGDVRMSVKTTGLAFVMPSNTNVTGEGHVHFTLDGEPFKMSVTPEYTYENVAPGEHTLEAELVQNDTEPFSPPVKQTVTFTAK